MINYIADIDCPASDFLHRNRIPHIYEDNSAPEALCKLPEILPHMAVYNVPEAYKFTPDEINMELIPTYAAYTPGESGTITSDGCVDNAENKIWVSWYETVKGHEAGRIWIVEETLLCNDNEGIKRPAIPMQPSTSFVPSPAVPFDNKMVEEDSYFGGAPSNKQVKELIEKYRDLLQRVQEAFSKLDKLRKGLYDWDINGDEDCATEAEDGEPVNNGSGGRDDWTTMKELKLKVAEILEATNGLITLPKITYDSHDKKHEHPIYDPCEAHIWLDIPPMSFEDGTQNMPGILIIKNGQFDVIPFPQAPKGQEKTFVPNHYLVFTDSNGGYAWMKACGGSGECESCKKKDDE